jgi:hypothetical protein
VLAWLLNDSENHKKISDCSAKKYLLKTVKSFTKISQPYPQQKIKC